MLLNKKGLTLIFAISITILGFSQNNKMVSLDSLIPKSIYITKPNFLQLNSNFNLDKRLQMDNFKFMYLNVKAIEDGYFQIPFTKLGGSPSSYIYDTYQKIYDNSNLKKSFFKVSKLYDLPYKPRK